MRQFLILGLLPILVACNDGTTGDTPVDASVAGAEINVPVLVDSLIDDAQTLEEMLARVDSVETAEQIRPSIETMILDYQTLFQTFESKEDLNFSEITALASRLPKLAERQRGLTEQIQRLYQDHPEAAQILSESLDSLGQP